MTNYDAQRFATEVEIIASNLVETLKKKNADYGNNVDKNIDEWGLASLAIRLDDKLNRFKNLIKESNTRQVEDEVIEDTLLDLAGYAILGYRKMQEMNSEKVDSIVEAINKIDSAPITPIPRKPVAPAKAVPQPTFSFNS